MNFFLNVCYKEIKEINRLYVKELNINNHRYPCLQFALNNQKILLMKLYKVCQNKRIYLRAYSLMMPTKKSFSALLFTTTRLLDIKRHFAQIVKTVDKLLIQCCSGDSIFANQGFRLSKRIVNERERERELRLKLHLRWSRWRFRYLDNNKSGSPSPSLLDNRTDTDLGQSNDNYAKCMLVIA